MTRDTGDDIQSSRQTATIENYNDNNSPGPHLACSLGLQVRSAVLALLVRGGVRAGQQEVRDVSCIVTQLPYSSLSSLTGQSQTLTSLSYLSYSPSQLSHISFTAL